MPFRVVCGVIIAIYIDRSAIIAGLNPAIKRREAPSVVLPVYHFCRCDH